jgi:Flp pilus assembly protein TadD
MKKLLPLALFMLLCTPLLAQSQPWAAVSDARRLDLDPNGCPQLEGLGVGALVSANPTPEDLGAVQRQLLAELEQQLRQMPKDSPEYKLLEAQLRDLRSQPAPATPTQTPSLSQAIAKLRQVLTRSLGAGSLAALQKSAEAKNAGLASRTAYLGFWQGKPAASLGLLLEAHKLEPKNPAHLVNLTALANYYSLYPEALALIGSAEKLRGNLEPGVLQANKGHALLLNQRFAQAETSLRAAIAANPRLNEPRINLAVALGMQQRCQEARTWLARGWWRSPFAQALEQETRPLEQKFITTAPVALPDSFAMVQPTLNGQAFDTYAFLPRINAATTARRQRLEQLKKVPLIAELRDQWLEGGLVEVLDSASRGVPNNALLSSATQNKYRTLERQIIAISTSGQPNICQNLIAPLEEQEALLRQAYQTSYRAAYAAASRLSEPSYRNYAQLRLVAVVDQFYRDLQNLRQRAEYAAQLAASRAEACPAPNLPPIPSGAMPPSPPICQPSLALAAPKLGMALTIACDQITLAQNPPAWLPRFGVLKNTPLERSTRNLRLMAFSQAGFAVLDSEKSLVDTGGVGTGTPVWRTSFDASRAAPVWFLSAEGKGGI